MLFMLVLINFLLVYRCILCLLGSLNCSMWLVEGKVFLLSMVVFIF